MCKMYRVKNNKAKCASVSKEKEESISFRYVLVVFLISLLLFIISWLFQDCIYVKDELTSIIISFNKWSTIISFLQMVLLPAVIFSFIICLLPKIVNKIFNIFKVKKIIVIFFNKNVVLPFICIFSITYACVVLYISFTSLNVLKFSSFLEHELIFSIKEGMNIKTTNVLLVIFHSLIYAQLLVFIKFIFNLNINKQEKSDNKILRSFLSIFKVMLYLLAFVVLFSADWILNTFGGITMESLIFHLNVPLKGTPTSMYISFFIEVLVPSIFILAIIVLMFLNLFTKKESYILSIFSLKIKIPRCLLSIILFIIPAFIMIPPVYKLSDKIGLGDYIKGIFNDSRFIDENYVDPRETEIIFPETKRNLIYIFMESMENTFMSKEEGGAMEVNLIPELTEIADENIYFSNTNTHGGAITMKGADWTIGAMVSQHMCVPLILPINGNSYDEYETFLPGGYSLGDILQKEGYNQTLLVGSDSEFAGRKAFYQQHGNYKILDLYTALEDKIIQQANDFWGYEDLYLYEYAKNELQYLSSLDEPFNLTMLTVDTHHPEGYYCSLCKNEHGKQYYNAISCASRQLKNFLFWLKQQDFYENTTIVVVGDHYSHSSFIRKIDSTGYVPTTYNVFINSAVSSENTKNRLFSNMDMLPTTLASLGVKINGDRLGLGINLFSSSTPTLLETYGKEYVHAGLLGYSKKYQSLLFGN